MKLFFLLIICALPIVSWAQVRTYFNQNQAHSYVDPYRKISRPGDNLERVLISEVAQARKSIYVAVQEMRLPLLAQALIDKKKAGVDVRIVMEHDYNFTVVDQRDTNNDEHEASKLAELKAFVDVNHNGNCLLYTSPSPRDGLL